MDVDANGEAKERGELETKEVNRAADFELTDYWNKGEVLNRRELWPVCVTLNIVCLLFHLGFVHHGSIVPCVDSCTTSHQTCTF